VKVIVCGACGRMGKEIISLCKKKGIKIEGAIEAPHHYCLGKEIEKGVRVSSDLERVIKKDNVIIEFTTPSATIEHLKIARKKKIPVVIGTTGFNEKEYSKIKETAKEIPILLSPNMSIGINLLFRLTEEITTRVGEEFDVEIIEMHHKNKKDAPSGTAKKIAEIIAKIRGKELSQIGIYGRMGIKKRTKEEVGIHAIRGGSIVGEHIVLFAGEGERLEIIHRAESRQIFARGALRAAEFIIKQKKGFYNLQDVLFK